MEQDMRPFLYCAVGLVLVGFTFSRADAQERGTTEPGAIPQNLPPTISQKPSIPPLRLSPTQRTEIQQALRSEDTEVSFALKSAKGAQNFTPSVGAKVPTALKLHPLPRPLVYEIQPLKRYSYVKFKHQVLIVNPMSREIVDMFPEA
jgi:Protein of unknown function (DUF1236)